MNGEICAPIHSGPFCFLLTAQDRFLLLNRGRYVLTDLGLEKRCRGCGDFWPADTEFFHCQPDMRDGLHGLCKPCCNEAKELRRQIQRRAPAPWPQAA